MQRLIHKVNDKAYILCLSVDFTGTEMKKICYYLADYKGNFNASLVVYVHVVYMRVVYVCVVTSQ